MANPNPDTSGLRPFTGGPDSRRSPGRMSRWRQTVDAIVGDGSEQLAALASLSRGEVLTVHVPDPDGGPDKVRQLIPNPHIVRQCCNDLLDRAFGKPMQALAVTTDPGAMADPLPAMTPADRALLAEIAHRVLLAGAQSAGVEAGSTIVVQEVSEDQSDSVVDPAPS